MREYGMSTPAPEKVAELDAADRILAANMKRKDRALVDAEIEAAHPVRDAMDGVW